MCNLRKHVFCSFLVTCFVLFPVTLHFSHYQAKNVAYFGGGTLTRTLFSTNTYFHKKYFYTLPKTLPLRFVKSSMILPKN